MLRDHVGVFPVLLESSVRRSFVDGELADTCLFLFSQWLDARLPTVADVRGSSRRWMVRLCRLCSCTCQSSPETKIRFITEETLRDRYMAKSLCPTWLCWSWWRSASAPRRTVTPAHRRGHVSLAAGDGVLVLGRDVRCVFSCRVSLTAGLSVSRSVNPQLASTAPEMKHPGFQRPSQRAPSRRLVNHPLRVRSHWSACLRFTTALKCL